MRPEETLERQMVVDTLFGDGSVAVLESSEPDPDDPGPDTGCFCICACTDKPSKVSDSQYLGATVAVAK